MGEALAFAAVAAATQVAESAAEARARNSAPVTHASTGVAVSPNCDNQAQYGCLTVTPSQPAAIAPEPEMTDDDAHDYVLGYVNGVRKLNAAAPIARDAGLESFAQTGSEELARDHRPNQHITEHSRELRGQSTELQGSPEGSRPGPLQDRIGEILLSWMAEGAGGIHHDALLRADWRKIGVGIANRDGRIYFTVDLATE